MCVLTAGPGRYDIFILLNSLQSQWQKKKSHFVIHWNGANLGKDFGTWHENIKGKRNHGNYIKKSKRRQKWPFWKHLLEFILSSGN